MAMAGGRSGEVGQGRGQVGQVGWVLANWVHRFFWAGEKQDEA